jgi:5-methylcytosine-specific restriction endonuclease McrA
MNIERRAKHAVYMRAYTAKNHDHICAQRRARYLVNRSKVLEAQHLYRTEPEVKARMKQYAATYYSTNKEKVAIQRAEYVKANVGKICQQRKEDHLAHKTERNAKKIARYHADPKKTIDRNRLWRNRNPEKVLAKNQRRRAAKAGVIIENVNTNNIYERDKGICGICGNLIERDKATLDHIVPLSRGGPHIASNLQIAHRSCNSSKGTKIILAANPAKSTFVPIGT